MRRLPTISSTTRHQDETNPRQEETIQQLTEHLQQFEQVIGAVPPAGGHPVIHTFDEVR